MSSSPSGCDFVISLFTEDEPKYRIRGVEISGSASARRFRVKCKKVPSMLMLRIEL